MVKPADRDLMNTVSKAPVCESVVPSDGAVAGDLKCCESSGQRFGGGDLDSGSGGRAVALVLAVTRVSMRPSLLLSPTLCHGERVPTKA